MSTLGEMKTSIASELMRDDLEPAIGLEISRAIKFYMPKRFWFNEKRTRVVFNMVIGQDTYTVADHPDIPNLIRIDSITSNRDGLSLLVKLVNQAQMELWLNSSSILSNPPAYYSYYEQALRFYPIPDFAYPVRVASVVRVAEPATDDEANNPWMNEAEELIRSRAKSKIFAHWMEDPASGATMAQMESEALVSLQAESSSRTQVNRLVPECI